MLDTPRTIGHQIIQNGFCLGRIASVYGVERRVKLVRRLCGIGGLIPAPSFIDCNQHDDTDSGPNDQWREAFPQRTHAIGTQFFVNFAENIVLGHGTP
ncbi:hypothetical protein PSQ90_15120 [Devosia rhodophyticola]|uniref:Transposase n=1 Tax=Devosia rhodophyticola TaxID=3026423 RepID=A0ABY7YW43_9HYPH|nr:hypothetical protein [Devosia rhodophyticola]WDR05583.1 hypothetical protein PSQ90_15120 [Devosia rhodophyticola]